MRRWSQKPLPFGLNLLLLIGIPSRTSVLAWRWDWKYSPGKMPISLSDFSATQALASDDEGDLHVLIYLIGGCADQTRSQQFELKQGDSNLNFRPGEIFPSCWDVSSTTLTYDPLLQLFSKRKDSLRKRYRHGAVVINGNIWVIGGRNSADDLVKEVDMYDPGHDQWYYVGDLPTDFLTSDMAIHAMPNGENIYVVGGYNENYQASSTAYTIDVERTLELFNQNPENKNQLVISKLASMNEKRGSIKAVAFSRYIFVSGGYTHEDTFCNPYHSVERYDIVNNTWSQVAGLSTPRANIGLVRSGDVFLAVGGDTRSSCTSKSERTSLPVDVVEIYTPLDGLSAAWKNVPIEPMDGRMRFAAFPWPKTSSILLFGGIINGPAGCNCYFSSDKVLIVSQVEKIAHRANIFLYISVSTVALISCLLCRCWMRKKSEQHRNLRDANEQSETGIMLQESVT